MDAITNSRRGRAVHVQLMECSHCRTRLDPKDMLGAEHNCPKCGRASWILILSKPEHELLLSKVHV